MPSCYFSSVILFVSVYPLPLVMRYRYTPTDGQNNVGRGVKTGNDTLLVGGAGGEHPGMNVYERMAVMTTAHEAAIVEVPVLTSIQHTDTRVIVELAQ